MHADEVRLLFDYSYAATARFLDAAGQPAPEEFVGPAPARGCVSPRDVLVHALDAEWGWREELIAGRNDAAPDLDPAAFPDVPALAQAWRADEARMRAWLAFFDDAAVHAPAFNGRPVWQCLAHIVNHGTQQHSEAAMMLSHF